MSKCCNSIGVSGDKVHWMRSKDGKLFWCRMAIAIMGSYNMPIQYVESVSPFEKYYQENFIQGKGKTKKEAIENMNNEAKDISNSLF